MNNYFNFMNLQTTLKEYNIKYDGEYLRYLKDIMNTKTELFSYAGIPEESGITSEIIETALLFRNNLCFYKHPGLGLVLCYYIYGSEFNYYWKPSYVTLVAFNGVTIATNVPYDDIVLLRDNRMDIIPFLTLNSWIDLVIEMERTLRINVILLRLPMLFKGDKNQVATLKQMIKKATNFEPFAIVDKKLGNDIIEPDKFELPCSLQELYDLIEKYRNLALSSIGIYASDTKRERLITAEINATNDMVDFVYQGMIEERQRAIKEVNEKWGYDIKITENYIINKKDENKLEAEKAKMIAEAENVEPKKKEGEPNA